MSNWSHYRAARSVRLMMPFTLALTLLAACSDDDVVDTNDPEVQAQIQVGEDRGDAMNDQIQQQLSDATLSDEIGQTAAIGVTLNDGEIAQAQIALDRTTDPEVRDFADMLVSDHAANTQAIENMLASRGIDLIESPVSDALQSDADAAAQTLEDTSSEPFDSIFLNMQVMTHAQARVIVDSFVDMIDDDDVASFWSDTGDMIEDHLNRAITLAEAR